MNTETKRRTAIAALVLLAAFAVQGCSSTTRESMKEDINHDARKVDRALS
jgi:predicted small secreted protein